MVKKRIGAVLQARMGSTRLPGKVLMPLPYGGQISLIGQIILRAQKTATLSEVILASSVAKENDSLILDSLKYGARVFRGDEADVLGRFYEAAKENELDVIVRLTGDNPFICSYVIDEAVASHLKAAADYTVTQGLPLGTNIEVVSFEGLEVAYKEAVDTIHREHVTTFIWQNPNRFKILEKKYEDLFHGKAPRLTVDFPSDYALACKVFEELYQQNSNFDLTDIAELLESKTWISLINSENVQKNV